MSVKNIFDKRKRLDENKIKWERVIYDDDSKQLKKLINSIYFYGNNSKKIKGNINSNNDSFSGSSNYFNRKPQNQRVTFKLHFGKSEKSHQVYLEYYMPQKNKEEVLIKPEVFGTPDDEYYPHMTAFHFKTIISPESQKTDLRKLTESFIAQVEKVTGYKLYWKAAIHENTNHKHAHLLINGIDKTGRKIRFSREFIKNEFRHMLSEITTQQIGVRSMEEIQAAKKGYVESKRFTELDIKLKELLSRFNPDTNSTQRIEASYLPDLIEKRASYLCDIGLCQKENKVYTLKENWDDILMATGRYNTFLNEYVEDNSLKLYESGDVKGKVVKVISFDKDEAWNDALIIATEENEKIYVPVYNLYKDNLEGKKVSISPKYTKRIQDSEIKVMKNFGPEINKELQ